MPRLVRLLPFLALLALAGAARADEKAPPLGRKVEPFTLQDHRGKEYSLGDFKDAKLVVLAFLGTECPLSKLYGARLAQLERDYRDKGVAFVGLNPNSQDSVTEIAAFVKTHNIGFPVLKDLGNKVADQVGARRTPVVFVLDRERVVRYWGRIDDQYGIGFSRDQAKEKDLANALDALLAGKAVAKAETEPVGCLIGRIRQPKADSAVTYSKHIAPLLQKRCVECHRKGDIAPFALTSYDEVVGWAGMIDEVVDEGRMPPWHADPKHGKFQNDRRLSDDEKKLIAAWVANGAPEGDKKDLPPAPKFVEGWDLPREPDLVVNMRERPYRVQAEGAVKYQYFIADSGLKEDRWIEAVEVQPGNRAVVHHILVAALKPGDNLQSLGGGVSGFLAAYVPGLRPIPYPAGMAKKIAAGSKLIFQVHYTPNGSEQEDRSKIGFIFADPAKIKYEVRTTSAAQRRLDIPPGEGNHEVQATSRAMPADALLLGLMPHMHVRGKSFFYEAVDADDKKETLLDVPRYDFNWQTAYRLSEPKKLPAGTRVHCVAHYDNSTKNPSNPDPTKRVGWGDQTWNEMMIGYFDIAVPVGTKPEKEEK